MAPPHVEELFRWLRNQCDDHATPPAAAVGMGVATITMLSTATAAAATATAAAAAAATLQNPPSALYGLRQPREEQTRARSMTPAFPLAPGSPSSPRARIHRVGAPPPPHGFLRRRDAQDSPIRPGRGAPPGTRVVPPPPPRPRMASRIAALAEQFGQSRIGHEVATPPAPPAPAAPAQTERGWGGVLASIRSGDVQLRRSDGESAAQRYRSHLDERNNHAFTRQSARWTSSRDQAGQGQPPEEQCF